MSCRSTTVPEFLFGFWQTRSAKRIFGLPIHSRSEAARCSMACDSFVCVLGREGEMECPLPSNWWFAFGGPKPGFIPSLFTGPQQVIPHGVGWFQLKVANMVQTRSDPAFTCLLCQAAKSKQHALNIFLISPKEPRSPFSNLRRWATGTYLTDGITQELFAQLRVQHRRVQT